MTRIHHFDHPILEEVAALEVPYPEDIVINHSAALAIWGIDLGREPNDIDMTASLINVSSLRQKIGWEIVRKVVNYRENGTPVTVMVTHDPDDRFDVHRWDFSRRRHDQTGHGRIYLPEQKERAYQDAVTGLYISTPEYVLETKGETGRPKDEQDIIAIEKYLGSR